MRLFFLLILCSSVQSLTAQPVDTAAWWHGKERTIRYHPEGNDFVITNGNRRFTRALYGTNTAFRAEAGDLPEFALYMPGMGGNIKFGLISGHTSKWLIHATKIVARYRPGSMLYDIEDPILGKGKLHVTLLAMSDAEGVIIKVQAEHIFVPVQLMWAYGGATGKKFSRDGDMGPDPESSFYLKPEYCTDNRYTLAKDHFTLQYGTGEILSEADRYENKNLPGDKNTPQKGKEQLMRGVFPSSSTLLLVDAAKQISPDELYHSKTSATPAVAGMLNIGNAPMYFSFCKPGSTQQIIYTSLLSLFEQAEAARKKLAERIQVNTPDAYINTIGGAVSVAADAIWEEPSYLHGAVGWRIRLNGWRGAYAGDVLGWHDRARMHFRSYAQSQVLAPLSGKIISDTALHLARQLEKMGTSLFSSGYISRNPGGDLRPHHYDMNLVFIDELLWHFKWTGDINFIKEMWPVIKRHLAWEKRNFDRDDDGLYDAYAAIWASDALEYSGGSVTHSSAYNYRANKMAAELAALIGEDAKPYRAEAEKILSAVNKILWIPEKGWYAEYKDAMGLQSVHEDAALWTVYHSIDGELPDAFKAYQTVKYVDENIPHIPVKAKGLANGYYTVSTSNWMPYQWSLNNVALAELMHTSLANWQAGRNEDAFILWKSALLESMYLGGSPGNFQQISTYDAMRGESYRDFADPVGMTARSLIQGLFGILPDALKNELTIRPGFPASWNHASLHTPDVQFDFKRQNNNDHYTISSSFDKNMRLRLLLKANGTAIESITVNGKKNNWKNIDSAISTPGIEIDCVPAKKYMVEVIWRAAKPLADLPPKIYARGGDINISIPGAIIQQVYDPQKILAQLQTTEHALHAVITGEPGNRTAFIRIKQGMFSWWQALAVIVKEPVEIIAEPHQPKNKIQFSVRNNTSMVIDGKLFVNAGVNVFTIPLTVAANASSAIVTIPYEHAIIGSNEVAYEWNNGRSHANIINWNMDGNKNRETEQVNIASYFNDKVTRIFKNEYLSPRPSTVTLQLPTQGIGEWTHPLQTASINDSGLRRSAANNNTLTLPQGISFQTPSDTLKPNILFTSQWNNYPKDAAIPLSGKASHVYLLMAGSTDPMQTHITNGAVIITYRDGTSDTLLLKNPETWWPIEQDYYDDGYAFRVNAPKPVRVHLKTGAIISEWDDTIGKYNGKMMDGGAATVLDMPLRADKTLRELRLQAWANDVVIGLMSVSLTR